MNIGSYSVEVLIHGKAAREFSHYINGEYKTFIEGRNGTNYSLRIKNHTGEKLLAISSVDGLNVVTGDLSDGYKGRGYIIQPYGEVTIKGFRESDHTVGSFMFASKGDSYASERGSEKNCGIIAVNLINEKPEITTIINDIQPYDPWRPKKYPSPYWSDNVTMTTSDSSGTTYMAGMETPIVANFVQTNFTPIKKSAKFDLGTKWGERVNDKITRKHFDKNIIVASFKIYYASRRSLEEMGVSFYPEKQTNDWPEGFTEDYCKPPKGWR